MKHIDRLCLSHVPSPGHTRTESGSGRFLTEKSESQQEGAGGKTPPLVTLSERFNLAEPQSPHLYGRNNDTLVFG